MQKLLTCCRAHTYRERAPDGEAGITQRNEAKRSTMVRSKSPASRRAILTAPLGTTPAGGLLASAPGGSGAAAESRCEAHLQGVLDSPADVVEAGLDLAAVDRLAPCPAGR